MIGVEGFPRNFYGDEMYNEAVRSRGGQFLHHLGSNWLELALIPSCFDQGSLKRCFKTLRLS